MVSYHTRIFVIAIVTAEYTALLLQKYVFKVCAVSIAFWSSCLKLYIHLCYINTHQQTTSQFSLWLPLSRVSLLFWYNKNTVLRFVWYFLVCTQLIINSISIHPASTHSDKQQHHLTSLTSYHVFSAKRQDCIRGQLIIVRDLLTPI